MCVCMCVEVQFISLRTLMLIMHIFKGHSYVRTSCCKKYVAKDETLANTQVVITCYCINIFVMSSGIETLICHYHTYNI